jgi:fatty acid/phospholipid biosynthesis enzyme
MRIALDAMGGDYAPKNTVEGAVLALKEYAYIEKLFLVGDAVATGNELKRLDFKDARIEIFHASEVARSAPVLTATSQLLLKEFLIPESRSEPERRDTS